jgi:hypothetical protein
VVACFFCPYETVAGSRELPPAWINGIVQRVLLLLIQVAT